MDSGNTYWRDRAMLEWQVELGVTDAIMDAPLDRYALDPKPEKKEAPVQAPPAIAPAEDSIDAVATARAAAAGAMDLPGLATAMEAFEHCELKRGARSFVFCEGDPSARVMICLLYTSPSPRDA